MPIQGGKRKLIDWLIGIGLDHQTWLWLRRRHPGLVARRLALGYLVVGVMAEGLDE